MGESMAQHIIDGFIIGVLTVLLTYMIGLINDILDDLEELRRLIEKREKK